MSDIKLFESKHISSVWDETAQRWYFAIVDVMAALTERQNPQVYWRVLKKRLLVEGNETVTACNALKLTAPDGKQRLTDVADTEQLLRIIQSVPSPKAEPFKRWLAHVGYERLEEIENPELAAISGEDGRMCVKVHGVDVFDPCTGEVRSDGADDPYKALKTTLIAEINEDTWATLNSDTSRPVDKPNSERIAVKVINHLGDEVMNVFRVYGGRAYGPA